MVVVIITRQMVKAEMTSVGTNHILKKNLMAVSSGLFFTGKYKNILVNTICLVNRILAQATNRVKIHPNV